MTKTGFFALWLMCCVPLSAQKAEPIPLEKEPHHELVYKDDRFLAFRVKMAPGETLLLHRHAYDEAALTVSSGTTAAIFPGQPETHQKDVPATVRFHRAGVVHEIRNVSDTPYYLHYSISLLKPQGAVHSLCAAADEGGPLNCPAVAETNPPAAFRVEPQYETEQMRASIVRIRAAQEAYFVGETGRDQFIVAIDDVTSKSGGAEKPLHPGDFLWVAHGSAPQQVRNSSDHEARLAVFSFKP